VNHRFEKHLGHIKLDQRPGTKRKCFKHPPTVVVGFLTKHAQHFNGQNVIHSIKCKKGIFEECLSIGSTGKKYLHSTNPLGLSILYALWDWSIYRSMNGVFIYLVKWNNISLTWISLKFSGISLTKPPFRVDLG